jgi:hypothetical protein
MAEENEFKIVNAHKKMHKDFKTITPHKDFWPKINVEYYRQQLVHDILNEHQNYFNKYQQYEFKNIFERWLLNSANIVDAADYIFASDVLKNINHELNKNFIYEMLEKKLCSPKLANYILNDIIKKASTFLNKKDDYAKEEITDSIVIYNYTNYREMTFRKYKKEIANDRYQILSKAGDENILIAALRYAGIISSSQHWQMPIDKYREYVEKYGVNLEGFASPFNSQLLLINQGNFCSLFLDTDKVFGSIGNFFDADLQNKVVAVNPPYVLSILDNMAKKCISECEKAEKLGNKIKLFIIMSAWRDTEAYISLSKSKYLLESSELKPMEHFYTDASDVRSGASKQIPAKFTTALFVLCKSFM